MGWPALNSTSAAPGPDIRPSGSGSPRPTAGRAPRCGSASTRPEPSAGRSTCVPAKSTKPSNTPHTPAGRRVEGPIQDPRRGRGNDLSRGPCLRPTPVPLPRHGEDKPPAPTHRRGDQPHPHRRLAHRHTPRSNPRQPPDSTSPRRIATGRSKRARINQQHPRSWGGGPLRVHSPCPAALLRDRSKARTRAGAGGAGWGRFPGCACSRSRCR